MAWNAKFEGLGKDDLGGFVCFVDLVGVHYGDVNLFAFRVVSVVRTVAQRSGWQSNYW